MTNVLATPLIESAKAPGLDQYLKPIVWGPMPPAEIMIATMKKRLKKAILILEEAVISSRKDSV